MWIDRRQNKLLDLLPKGFAIDSFLERSFIKIYKVSCKWHHPVMICTAPTLFPWHNMSQFI